MKPVWLTVFWRLCFLRDEETDPPRVSCLYKEFLFEFNFPTLQVRIFTTLQSHLITSNKLCSPWHTNCVSAKLKHNGLKLLYLSFSNDFICVSTILTWYIQQNKDKHRRFMWADFELWVKRCFVLLDTTIAIFIAGERRNSSPCLKPALKERLDCWVCFDACFDATYITI